MIPLYDEDGDRLKHTYNGFDLNDAADDADDTVLIDEITSSTPIDSKMESGGLKDGVEVYGAYKRLRQFRFDLQILVPSYTKMFDRLETLAAAFDPALAWLNNQSAEGFLSYDFDVPTNDTVNYPSGLIACRYYLRAASPIEPPISRYDGRSLPFSIYMLARDPRRYFRTQQSLTGAGEAVNTLATYPSWPTVTITMAGAGNAAYSVGNSELGKTLVLDLSGLVASDVVVVDMERKKITKNGVETPSLYVSGDYFYIVEALSNTIAIANGTNATTVTTWLRAFSN